MIGRSLAVGSLLIAALAGGCAQPMPGTSRPLGDVTYDDAFTTGRQVMAQYFPLAQIDEWRGMIISQPTPLAQQRLVGGAQQRQVARLRLRRQASTVVAEASVEIQRQASQAHGAMRRPQLAYDAASLYTPAEAEAATTPQQNEMWVAVHYNHALEARLLEQLYARLHGPPATTQAE